MKKIFLLLLVPVLLLVGCSPEPEPFQTSSAVTIPEAVQVGIGGLLLALFTAGFVYVFEKTGLDLRGTAVPIAASLSTFLVGELQKWINLVPPVHDPLLIMGLNILGILLAGFGALRLFSKQRATLLP